MAKWSNRPDWTIFYFPGWRFKVDLSQFRLYLNQALPINAINDRVAGEAGNRVWAGAYNQSERAVTRRHYRRKSI